MDERNRRPQSESDEKRMELTEHLGELRSRLMRSILYLVVGAILAYQFFTPLYGALYQPLKQEMDRQNRKPGTIVSRGVQLESDFTRGSAPTKDEFDRLVRDIRRLYESPPRLPLMSMNFQNFYDPFMVRVKVSVIFGFILVMPFILWELGAFIAPALTPQERRPLRLLVPISAFLALLGVLVAYVTMYQAMRWFLSYLSDFPQPATVMQDPNSYILFFVKMMAAFGLAFQLPVALTFGAFVGLVTSKGLIKHWRYGVLTAALGATFIPTNDVISMTLIGVSLLILYGGSILLVRLVERMKAREQRRAGG